MINIYILGGVDTLDHLIEKFTCRRMTRRWTFNIFMYLLDVAAYNSFALFAIKNPKNMEKNLKLKRRQSLKALGKELVDPLIEKRAFKIEASGFNGIHKHLLENLSIYGFKATNKTETNIPIDTLSTRLRCISCVNDKEISKSVKEYKHTNVCSICFQTFCKKHCQSTIICNNC